MKQIVDRIERHIRDAAETVATIGANLTPDSCRSRTDQAPASSPDDSVFLRRVLVLFGVLASLCLTPWTASGKEGWSFEGQSTLFYTDDAGLFSATHRLSRDGDPTQPAIDSALANQGSDMVFEPLLNVNRSLTNGLGQLDLNMRGQRFYFHGQS